MYHLKPQYHTWSSNISKEVGENSCSISPYTRVCIFSRNVFLTWWTKTCMITIKRRNNKCMGCVHWCEHMECNLALVQIGDLDDRFHPSFSEWIQLGIILTSYGSVKLSYADILLERAKLCLCMCTCVWKQVNTELMLMKQDQQQKLQIKHTAPTKLNQTTQDRNKSKFLV